MLGTSLVIQTVYYLPLVFTKVLLYYLTEFDKYEQEATRRLAIWYYVVGTLFGFITVLGLTEHFRKVKIKTALMFQTSVILISIIIFSLEVLN